MKASAIYLRAARIIDSVAPWGKYPISLASLAIRLAANELGPHAPLREHFLKMFGPCMLWDGEAVLALLFMHEIALDEEGRK